MAGLSVLKIYNMKQKGWKKRTVFLLFSASGDCSSVLVQPNFRTRNKQTYCL